MSEPGYRVVDLGDRRVLTVDGRQHSTYYSERVIHMLVERKGEHRAPLYFPFKETRGRHFLGPLFRHVDARALSGLSVLEVGCSFGHITEYLAEQPAVARITSYDTDAAFIEIVRTKVDEMRLSKVRDVRLLSNDETRRLPWADGTFDLVLAVGVVEHLPERHRRAQVDEYYRVLAPGGHIAILDTPNRWFPYESHSVGLPFVQWLPPRLAYRYARLKNPVYAKTTYQEFEADDGAGWRNATLRECQPSWGMRSLEDLTEIAGYGWQFFRSTVRSRSGRALLPLLVVGVALLRRLGQPPSQCLPYLNLLFRKLPAATPGA
jgi:SAM-dependent methyltransferase